MKSYIKPKQAPSVQLPVKIGNQILAAVPQHLPTNQ